VIRSLFRYRAGDLVANPAEIEESLRGPLPADAVAQLFQEVATESADPSSFIWVKMQDPTETEIADLQRIFGLSPVQIDEIKDPRQRPALESDPPKVFVILKELRYVEETSDVETGQVSVFLGPGFALSIRYGDAAPGSSRDRLTQEPELLTYGPAGVLYAICDVIVDGYLNVSRELDLDVSEIEERIFADDLDDLVTDIYQLKRENLELRRALSPLLVTARALTREEGRGTPPEMKTYFRDLGDHILQAYDLADSHDQLLMALLMAVTSRQEMRQSEDMRRISAYAAIIAVPTAIAGIYGMNFVNMPGLESSYGYPIVLAAMIGSCLLLYRAFKRSGWL